MVCLAIKETLVSYAGDGIMVLRDRDAEAGADVSRGPADLPGFLFLVLLCCCFC